MVSIDKASSDEPGEKFCILIGAEQGFCGDFNESLLSRMELLCQQKRAPPRWLVVGRRLAGRVGERDCLEQALPGATVADEVPAVLLRLTKELSRLLPLRGPNGLTYTPSPMRFSTVH